MGSLSSTAAFLSQASMNPCPHWGRQDQGPAWGANADDHVDTYFECITACSLDDGECVTRCVETLRESS